LAVIVHNPDVIVVTVVPETVHLDVGDEVKVRARPVETVALTVKVPVPKVLLASAGKVIV